MIIVTGERQDFWYGQKEGVTDKGVGQGKRDGGYQEIETRRTAEMSNMWERAGQLGTA